MTVPLVLIPGIASDRTVWRHMPTGQVMQSTADTIEAMAADILDRAPDRFALAGHSMGGYIALAMIALAPGRITRLALLSTSAAADDPAQSAGRVTVMAAAQAGFDAVVTALTRVMLHSDAHRNEMLMAEMNRMMRDVGVEAFIRQQRATMNRPDRTGQLGAITVPTLILTGENDRVLAPLRSAEMAAAIPHARLVTIPRCGHVPQQEAPVATAVALNAWREPRRA